MKQHTTQRQCYLHRKSQHNKRGVVERLRRNWRKPVVGVRAAVIFASVNCGIRLVTRVLPETFSAGQKSGFTDILVTGNTGGYWKTNTTLKNFSKRLLTEMGMSGGCGDGDGG